MTASAYSLSPLYPAGALEATAGEPVLGGLRRAARHFFCPSCPRWLFTRLKGLPDFVNVRATMFDNARAPASLIETYRRKQLPVADTGATHTLNAFPPPVALTSLLAAHATQAFRQRNR